MCKYMEDSGLAPDKNRKLSRASLLRSHTSLLFQAPVSTSLCSPATTNLMWMEASPFLHQTGEVPQSLSSLTVSKSFSSHPILLLKSFQVKVLL